MAYLMPKDQNLSPCAALTKISRKRGTSCDSEPPAGANQLVVNLWMSLLKVGSLGSKTAAKLSYPLVAIGQFEPGSKISEESRGIQRNPEESTTWLGKSAQFWASLRSEGPHPHLSLQKNQRCADDCGAFRSGIFIPYSWHIRASPKSRDSQTFPNSFQWFHVVSVLVATCGNFPPTLATDGLAISLFNFARQRIVAVATSSTSCHAMPCHERVGCSVLGTE